MQKAMNNSPHSEPTKLNKKNLEDLMNFVQSVVNQEKRSLITSEEAFAKLFGYKQALENLNLLDDEASQFFEHGFDCLIYGDNQLVG